MPSSSMKPEPKTINVVCTVCGLDYTGHGDDPTLEDCVRLLKAELARRPKVVPASVPWGPPLAPPTRPAMPWQNPIICQEVS